MYEKNTSTMILRQLMKLFHLALVDASKSVLNQFEASIKLKQNINKSLNCSGFVSSKKNAISWIN